MGIDLFKSYFTKRYQTVSIDNELSEKVEIKMGVGQGTILGPTLFNLYLHDLPKTLNCLTIQFADDTTLFITGKTEEELELKVDEQLGKVFNWLKDNGLSINQEKTRIIQFSGKDIRVTLNGEELTKCNPNETEKFFNLLGIHIDKQLKWNYHLEKILCKLGKGLYTLSRFKYSLSKKSKLLIFHSLIMSHLRYGISLWGKSKGPNFNKIIKTVKTGLRKIEIGKIHTDPIYKKYSLLKLSDIYKQEMTCQAWKYFNRTLPQAIDSNLTRRNIAHELRHESRVDLPRILKPSDKNQYEYSL